MSSQQGSQGGAGGSRKAGLDPRKIRTQLGLGQMMGRPPADPDAAAPGAGGSPVPAGSPPGSAPAPLTPAGPFGPRAAPGGPVWPAGPPPAWPPAGPPPAWPPPAGPAAAQPPAWPGAPAAGDGGVRSRVGAGAGARGGPGPAAPPG
ncbi:MAG: hypothetical protein HY744_16105 [Deltaproteobacteria bacterium]|nr:hypothetical protein [Deltaproteobacteria bacterium]